MQRVFPTRTVSAGAESQPYCNQVRVIGRRWLNVWLSRLEDRDTGSFDSG